MSLQTDIEKYFDIQKSIHEAFGYQEDWKVIPMDDQTNVYWMLADDEESGSVGWSYEPFTQELIEAGTNFYSGQIYTQRFLTKFVYRTETHVMISVDTQCDGNKFLMIFDASKECTDPAMIETFKNYWA